VSGADWSRECKGLFEWSPSRSLLASIRGYQRASRLTRWVYVIRHRFWSIVTGADIPLNCYWLGGGLYLPHPNGIVIHPASEIGKNCTIFQQVTIGATVHDDTPIIGDDVCIGAGAKLLGAIMVGDRARIGANAVVLGNVPEGATAVGIPAKIIVREALHESLEFCK
jgi:serine O-acetyltransferase